MVNGQAGKGDDYRKVDRDKYEMNYYRIYGNCSRDDCSKAKQCVRHYTNAHLLKGNQVPVGDINNCKWFIKRK